MSSSAQKPVTFHRPFKGVFACNSRSVASLCQGQRISGSARGDGDAAGGEEGLLCQACALPSLVVKYPGANGCLALLLAENTARREGLKQLPFKNYF